MSEKMMRLEQVGPQKEHLENANKLQSERFEKMGGKKIRRTFTWVSDGGDSRFAEHLKDADDFSEWNPNLKHETRWHEMEFLPDGRVKISASNEADVDGKLMANISFKDVEHGGSPNKGNVVLPCGEWIDPKTLSPYAQECVQDYKNALDRMEANKE